MSRKTGEKNLPLVPDGELWDVVKAAVKPLARRIRAAKPELLDKPVPAKIHPRPKPVTLKPKASVPEPKVTLSRPAAPPPLTGLDRRTTQRLARGKTEIEARLDLHGYTLELARVELRRFLAEARAHHLRMVLIITGKGESPFARHTLHGKQAWHAPERMGRLRRAVTDWFDEPEFRAHITGFQPAHPKHGGGGAYYVRLRKP